VYFEIYVFINLRLAAILSIMSTVRLTFLYPHLFRAARLTESAVQPTKTRYRSRLSRSSQCSHSFSTSARAGHAVFERHGHAVEPIPVNPDVVKLPQPSEITPQLPEPPPEETKKANTAEKSSSKKSDEPHKTDTQTGDVRQDTSASSDGRASDDKGKANASSQQAAEHEKMQQSGPMGAVLHIPEQDLSQSRRPHILKPTYVHHFDSYTLVKQLEGGGYTREQAITVMKAVRAILAQNLDVAQEGLVGKSDVDNVG